MTILLGNLLKITEKTDISSKLYYVCFRKTDFLFFTLHISKVTQLAYLFSSVVYTMTNK